MLLTRRKPIGLLLIKFLIHLYIILNETMFVRSIFQWEKQKSLHFTMNAFKLQNKSYFELNFCTEHQLQLHKTTFTSENIV